MNSIINDNRTRDDLLKYIKKVAKQYTPEWQFDEDNLDIGGGLTYLYVEMFLKTIKQFNQIPEKNQRAFFNSFHTKLLPAQTSSGYITFHLVNNEVKGVEVPSGAGIIAESNDNVEQIRFETCNNLYVTPSEVVQIFQTMDSEDDIRHIYNSDNVKNELNQKGFSLFSSGYSKDRPNIQKHELYFSQSEVFHITQEAWIELSLFSYQDTLIQSAMIDSLMDTSCVVFEYYTENGFIPFEKQKNENGKIVLYKSKNQKSFVSSEICNIKNNWIRCNVINIQPFLEFSFDRAMVRAKGTDIFPEIIYGAGIECLQKKYFPFGEQLSIYSEVYFASDEVLNKKGAWITLSFKLDYRAIPLQLYEGTEESNEIEYKWIMKRNKIKQEKEYDITISEVQWEYYNGKGWSRLFKNDSYQDIFCFELEKEESIRTITFLCPRDISAVLVESCESFYIRARITKINNEYKVNGKYITPVMSNTKFCYQYPEEGVALDEIITRNNLEWKQKRGIHINNSKNMLTPFIQTGIKEATIYFGFPISLDYGTIKMLFIVGKRSLEKCPALRWEYYGTDSWKELHVIDETNNFEKTGLLTIIGKQDFQIKRMFGEALYWIRVIDETGQYSREKKRYRPFIESIHINSIKVKAINKSCTEWFTASQYNENLKFKLSQNSIINIEVWVRESECIDDNEEDCFKKWEEVEDFTRSTPLERHFLIDRIEGEIQFGNGENGKIVPITGKDNIKVVYQNGGGECTNLKKGSTLKLERAYGFINAVTNEDMISGGKDQEKIEEAIKRSSATLKHRYRAVTIYDYENLVYESSRNILYVKCFSNRNQNAEKYPGYITLVIIRNELERNPDYFEKVRDEILYYLEDKMDVGFMCSSHFQIIEPRFVKLNIKVEIVVDNIEKIFSVKRATEEKLEMYLGFDYNNISARKLFIGDFPTEIQIKNILQTIPGVVCVKNLQFYKAFHPYVFVLNGCHEIEISVDEV